eukprot:TRINITY_DN7351_c0_g1_i2.p1 TRINITY_DN7351_c0_g1~~TRINITY_DN7351_c0_g1_i2.p1  ORF type:complete len:419 (+),score=33.97 TRINITY_DN7351_c0_g1_i2:167-1423(+)
MACAPGEGEHPPRPRAIATRRPQSSPAHRSPSPLLGRTRPVGSSPDRDQRPTAISTLRRPHSSCARRSSPPPQRASQNLSKFKSHSPYAEQVGIVVHMRNKCSFSPVCAPGKPALPSRSTHRPKVSTPTGPSGQASPAPEESSESEKRRPSVFSIRPDSRLFRQLGRTQGSQRKAPTLGSHPLFGHTLVPRPLFGIPNKTGKQMKSELRQAHEHAAETLRERSTSAAEELKSTDCLLARAARMKKSRRLGDEPWPHQVSKGTLRGIDQVLAHQRPPEIASLLFAAYMITLPPELCVPANFSWQAFTEFVSRLGGAMGFVEACQAVSSEQITPRAAHKIAIFMLSRALEPGTFTKPGIDPYAVSLCRWMWGLCHRAFNGAWLGVRDRRWVNSVARREASVAALHSGQQLKIGRGSFLSS